MPAMQLRCNPTLLHSQSIISQLCTSSRMISLCRSIFQCEYKDRAAAAALRCPGPFPPFIASSCDLHRQVARFLPSLSGLPNQYLPLLLMRFSYKNSAILTPTSEIHHWPSLLHVLPCLVRQGPRTQWWAGSVIERPQRRTKSPSTGDRAVARVVSIPQ